MSKSGFGQLYRRLSSKLLDLVVTPMLLAKFQASHRLKSRNWLKLIKITCYVLQNYSRSNALIVDAETRRLQLAPALDPLVIAEHKEKLRFFSATS